MFYTYKLDKLNNTYTLLTYSNISIGIVTLDPPCPVVLANVLFQLAGARRLHPKRLIGILAAGVGKVSSVDLGQLEQPRTLQDLRHQHSRARRSLLIHLTGIDESTLCRDLWKKNTTKSPKGKGYDFGTKCEQQQVLHLPATTWNKHGPPQIAVAPPHPQSSQTDLLRRKRPTMLILTMDAWFMFPFPTVMLSASMWALLEFVWWKSTGPAAAIVSCICSLETTFTSASLPDSSWGNQAHAIGTRTSWDIRICGVHDMHEETFSKSSMDHTERHLAEFDYLVRRPNLGPGQGQCLTHRALLPLPTYSRRCCLIKKRHQKTNAHILCINSVLVYCMITGHGSPVAQTNPCPWSWQMPSCGRHPGSRCKQCPACCHHLPKPSDHPTHLSVQGRKHTMSQAIVRVWVCAIVCMPSSIMALWVVLESPSV